MKEWFRWLKPWQIDSEQKYILGISAFFHDSAAVLILNGQILAAVQEERFSRRKMDAAFPHNAIKYCLSFLPEGRDLDAVVFYENPVWKLDRFYKNAMGNYPKGGPIWIQTLKSTNWLNTDLIENMKALVNDDKKIFFIPHHVAHAASAYYPSGFDQAAVLVVDGVGEWSTTSIYHGEGKKISGVLELEYPHSLGMFYSAFTQYCGFKVNSGEYKLMGLAPFGEPRFKKLIYDNLIEVRSDGSFRLNLTYFTFMNENSTVNSLFGRLFGIHSRHPSEPITRHFQDVAASAQAVAQEVMKSLAATALRLTKSSNLCLAGGVALNCVANSAIINGLEEIKKIWIQPAAGDAGGALGAAIMGHHRLSKNRISGMSPFLGPEFSYEEIKVALEGLGVKYTYFKDEGMYLNAICEELQNGEVLGFFEGRMEFGPRALGNRSILADPRPSEMLRTVNRKIKFREPWRPFAPAILEEHVEKYFDGHTESPYMLLTAKMKSEYRKEVDLEALRAQDAGVERMMRTSFSDFPAITHCDFSSRIQTVNKSNGRFYRLLVKFFEKSGCPMLLNTSFNVRGEPMVCSPDDALGCFFNTNMSILAMGQFLIRKSQQKDHLRKRVGKTRFGDD